MLGEDKNQKLFLFGGTLPIVRMGELDFIFGYSTEKKSDTHTHIHMEKNGV